MFQQILNDKIKVNNLQNKDMGFLERELFNWMEVIKEVINKSIPKNNYNIVYQIKSTEHIDLLQILMNNLKDDIMNNGMSMLKFRFFQRIKVEL